jgi:hypothetical protein
MGERKRIGQVLRNHSQNKVRVMELALDDQGQPWRAPASCLSPQS